MRYKQFSDYDKAIQEMMKYEHEGFINISLARLDEILKNCGVNEWRKQYEHREGNTGSDKKVG